MSYTYCNPLEPQETPYTPYSPEALFDNCLNGYLMVGYISPFDAHLFDKESEHITIRDCFTPNTPEAQLYPWSTYATQVADALEAHGRTSYMRAFIHGI